jgi:hypothetical protein
MGRPAWRAENRASREAAHPLATSQRELSAFSNQWSAKGSSLKAGTSR